jgi:hypothetical protein
MELMREMSFFPSDEAGVALGDCSASSMGKLVRINALSISVSL